MMMKKKKIANINHSDSFNFFEAIAQEVNHQDYLNRKLYLDMKDPSARE